MCDVDNFWYFAQSSLLRPTMEDDIATYSSGLHGNTSLLSPLHCRIIEVAPHRRFVDS